MRDYSRRMLIPAIVALLILAGCSNGNEVVTPGDIAADAAPSHLCWGFYQFTADPAEGTLDVAQLRMAEFHLNALPFLEPPALVNLTLDTLHINGSIIDADIGLRHPFLGLNEFTGFDVCGVLITSGSISGFGDSAIRIAGPGDTRLLNPDGLTRWWNPSEFPINTGTIFGYNDGLLGAPDSAGNFSATVNAYKYYTDGLAPDADLADVTLTSRGKFSAGQKNVRHYTIELGNAGLVFNYAVDASWKFPSGSPPYVAPDDFAEDANKVEAWRADVTETSNTLWNDGNGSGGSLNLSIDVYDWFNAG